VTSAGNLPLMLSPTVLHRRSTILVVDDEESLRLYLARVLEEEGYRVITARDGSSALALIERAGDSVRLVITDVSMPNLSGPELARRVATRPAAPPVLFISGTDSGLNLPGPLLPKPFLPEELTRLVRCMVPEEPLSHAVSRDAGAPWRAPVPGRQATS
jgi:DNA-binding response OmpR family regulator